MSATLRAMRTRKIKRLKRLHGDNVTWETSEKGSMHGLRRPGLAHLAHLGRMCVQSSVALTTAH